VEVRNFGLNLSRPVIQLWERHASRIPGVSSTFVKANGRSNEYHTTTERSRTSGALRNGSVHFAGSDSGLYERHLLFDNVVAAERTDARDDFEAFARSGRDVLSQRWTLTQDTYTRTDAKRIYYLSMEFLIGCSLANNVTNLLLGPVVSESIRKKNLDWIELLEQEPDAALGNGGLGRLAACFMESMATMQLPAMGYGLRYEYGIFKQTVEDGWQRERPDNSLRRQDPWEVARPHESVEIRLNRSFEVRGGALRTIPGRRSSLIGIPFDRPVVGYGGANIKTPRLWAAGAPDYFDFQAFSHGDFVQAVAETLEAESITRVLYPGGTVLAQHLSEVLMSQSARRVCTVSRRPHGSRRFGSR
jgi:starch phosphorylase